MYKERKKAAGWWGVAKRKLCIQTCFVSNERKGVKNYIDRSWNFIYRCCLVVQRLLWLKKLIPRFYSQVVSNGIVYFAVYGIDDYFWRLLQQKKLIKRREKKYFLWNCEAAKRSSNEGLDRKCVVFERES